MHIDLWIFNNSWIHAHTIQNTPLLGWKRNLPLVDDQAWQPLRRRGRSVLIHRVLNENHNKNIEDNRAPVRPKGRWQRGLLHDRSYPYCFFYRYLRSGNMFQTPCPLSRLALLALSLHFALTIHPPCSWWVQKIWFKFGQYWVAVSTDQSSVAAQLVRTPVYDSVAIISGRRPEHVVLYKCNVLLISIVKKSMYSWCDVCIAILVLLFT